MNLGTEIIKQVAVAFATESGPAGCGSPRHCEECEEADRMLLDLDPRDLNLDDLSNESRSWIFSFATDESIRWLTPGMVRVAMEQSPPRPGLFFDLVSNRASDLFSNEQWGVVLELADYCCAEGWLKKEELETLGPDAP